MVSRGFGTAIKRAIKPVATTAGVGGAVVGGGLLLKNAAKPGDEVPTPANSAVQQDIPQFLPPWWPEGLDPAVLTIQELKPTGDPAEPYAMQTRPMTWPEILDFVRNGGLGPELAKQVRGQEVGEPELLEIGGQQYVRNPATGSLQPLDIPSYDQTIVKAIADGDWDLATYLRDFRNEPTDLERFQAALDYAKSPTDSFIISAIARGVQAGPSTGIGDVQRLGPPPSWLTDAYIRLFGKRPAPPPTNQQLRQLDVGGQGGKSVAQPVMPVTPETAGATPFYSNPDWRESDLPKTVSLPPPLFGGQPMSGPGAPLPIVLFPPQPLPGGTPVEGPGGKYWPRTPEPVLLPDVPQFPLIFPTGPQQGMGGRAGVQAFAGGGMASGGPIMVGERGPELIPNAPPGLRVEPIDPLMMQMLQMDGTPGYATGGIVGAPITGKWGVQYPYTDPSGQTFYLTAGQLSAMGLPVPTTQPAPWIGPNEFTPDDKWGARGVQPELVVGSRIYAPTRAQGTQTGVITGVVPGQMGLGGQGRFFTIQWDDGSQGQGAEQTVRPISAMPPAPATPTAPTVSSTPSSTTSPTDSAALIAQMKELPAIQQLLSGAPIEPPKSLFAASGLRVPSPQGWANLLPSEQDAYRSLGTVAGFTPADFEYGLLSGTPGGPSPAVRRAATRAPRFV